VKDFNDETTKIVGNPFDKLSKADKNRIKNTIKHEDLKEVFNSNTKVDLGEVN